MHVEFLTHGVSACIFLKKLYFFNIHGMTCNDFEKCMCIEIWKWIMKHVDLKKRKEINEKKWKKWNERNERKGNERKKGLDWNESFKVLKYVTDTSLKWYPNDWVDCNAG